MANGNGVVSRPNDQCERCHHPSSMVYGVGVAGTCSSSSGPANDGGPATSARLGEPADIAFDSSGNLYISEVKVKAKFERSIRALATSPP